MLNDLLNKAGLVEFEESLIRVPLAMTYEANGTINTICPSSIRGNCNRKTQKAYRTFRILKLEEHFLPLMAGEFYAG